MCSSHPWGKSNSSICKESRQIATGIPERSQFSGLTCFHFVAESLPTLFRRIHSHVVLDPWERDRLLKVRLMVGFGSVFDRPDGSST